jgi:hypothetical protein
VNLALARSVVSVLGIFFAAAAVAAPEEVPATATGYGKTEQEALGDALARAAAQVNGGTTVISTGTLRAESQTQVTTNVGIQGDIKSQGSVQLTPDFTARGQVARYEVLSSASKAPDRHEVRVKAWIYKYEAPTRTGKLDRVGVLPIEAPAGALDFYREQMSHVALADEIGREVERTLIATGHFQVLDRATLGKSVGELSLMNTNLTNAQEKAKLQNVRGADFLVSSTLFVTRAGERSPATGQVMPARIELDARVLVPATSEVAYSARVPVQTTGFATKQEAIAAAVNQLVRGLDVALKGKSVLAESAKGPETPRDDAGVKLPFDK